MGEPPDGRAPQESENVVRHDPLTTRRIPGVVKLSWWHAGGLHAHVTYPDGSTLHRIWPKDSWWEIDALRFELEREYESVDVKP